MPEYRYKCDSCMKTFDIQQKITEEPLSKCQECGQNTMHRIPVTGDVAIQFKGSGFYKTDYAKPNSQDIPEKKKGSGGCGSSSCGCKS